MTSPMLPTRMIGRRAVSFVSLGFMNLSHAYGVPPGVDKPGRLLTRRIRFGRH